MATHIPNGRIDHGTGFVELPSEERDDEINLTGDFVRDTHLTPSTPLTTVSTSPYTAGNRVRNPTVSYSFCGVFPLWFHRRILEYSSDGAEVPEASSCEFAVTVCGDQNCSNVCN